MKKGLFFVVTFFAFLLIFSGVSFAVGTCLQGTPTSYDSGGAPITTLIFTCTADAAPLTPTVPDTAISAANTELLKGWSLYKIDIIGNHGGVEPGDDCDVYLYQTAGGVTKAIDLLDGNGVDKLDKDVNYSITPGINGLPAMQPFVGIWILSVANITVNSALFYIILYFTP